VYGYIKEELKKVEKEILFIVSCSSFSSFILQRIFFVLFSLFSLPSWVKFSVIHSFWGAPPYCEFPKREQQHVYKYMAEFYVWHPQNLRIQLSEAIFQQKAKSSVEYGKKN
jgi:hypothetical protein